MCAVDDGNCDDGAERKRVTVTNDPFLSGREDLNLRPHRPERCALAGLRHAPSECDYSARAVGCKESRVGGELHGQKNINS